MGCLQMLLPVVHRRLGLPAPRLGSVQFAAPEAGEIKECGCTADHHSLSAGDVGRGESAHAAHHYTCNT
jgi:hypothetical protein